MNETQRKKLDLIRRRANDAYAHSAADSIEEDTTKTLLELIELLQEVLG